MKLQSELSKPSDSEVSTGCKKSGPVLWNGSLASGRGGFCFGF